MTISNELLDELLKASDAEGKPGDGWQIDQERVLRDVDTFLSA